MAKKHNISRAQIALAWLLNKQEITAPIIGTTKVTQLEDCIQSLDIFLGSRSTLFRRTLCTTSDI
ncbi:aldo/keto reductase [Listeria monocytogenes]|nr:aldo/keto reductase [Listeria monocytogenes]